MAKKQSNPRENNAIDIIALFLALFYMQSVLTVAHRTSLWIHDGSAHTVGPPATLPLIIGLFLVGYSWSKSRARVSTIGVITLTIFATASLFWLSGLRTNFYF